MRQVVRLVGWVCAMALAVATSVSAADTGSVSGAVFDADGKPVADVTVRISGSRLPLGRTTDTGSNGLYLFEYLLPGEYLVEVENAPQGRSRRPALVEVEKDTQVDLVVGLSLQEELTVSAARPVIDVRTAAVNFNFTSAAFNALPLERTYRGLFQLMPGVADNRSVVGPAAGGGRQDNTYLVDGANITNPAFGYLSTEINELDIAEVNLKRAAVSAEFGRAVGSVVNAVSRSGTNQFVGVSRVEWLADGLLAAFALPDDVTRLGATPGAFRDPILTTTVNAAYGIGGPVKRNHAFFYTSGRVARDAKSDRSNKVSTLLPDETRTGYEVYGKLTAVPTSAQQMTITYRHRPSHVENAGLTSDYAPTTAFDRDNGSRVTTMEWARFFSAGRSFNVQYLNMREQNEDEPVLDLGYLPAFDPRNLPMMGQYTDSDQANLIVGGAQYANLQNYRRHELRGRITQPFDLGSTGHTLKAGVGYEFGAERLERLTNGWGQIAPIEQSGVPALRTRYFTAQAPQIGEGRTWSIFAQDDVTIGARWSANLGLLLNRDAFSQTVDGSGGCPASVPPGRGVAVNTSKGDRCTFLRFGFGSEVQPRLGISYQVRETAGDKVYASWGRYYNMDQKSSARSLAPSRVYQTQTVFDLNGRVLSTGPLASTTGKLIDPDLQPIYSDEILAGYATPVTANTNLDVYVISRGMHNFIEDLPSRVNGTAPNSGPFVAANLPCTSYAACRGADGTRTYRAVTFDLRRRLAGTWSADVSYTWSRFQGNYDIDYSLPTTAAFVFNTSSFIQDGPGTDVQDPNRFGPLFEDRPHVFKAFGTWQATDRLAASGYLRVQSGTPWAARARDWAGGSLNFLEPSGTHRNPTWTNLDLMAVYRVPFRSGRSLLLEARLLNAANTQTRLSTDALQYLDLRMVAAPPYFAPYLQSNPFFGTGNSFAPPRRLHLVAVLNF